MRNTQHNTTQAQFMIHAPLDIYYLLFSRQTPIFFDRIDIIQDHESKIISKFAMANSFSHSSLTWPRMNDEWY